MKVIEREIKVLPWDEALKEMDKEADHVFKELEAGKKNIKPSIGTYFHNVDLMRKTLTPERLKILHLVRTKNPKTVYGLAKLAGRSYPNVLADVKELESERMLDLEKKSGKRNGRKPRVSYDTIKIEISLKNMA